MFAVVFIPDFALQAVLRHAPELRERPVALLDEKSARGKIVQLTAAARAAGVQPGLTAPQALARCRDIILRPLAPADEAIAQETLLQCAFALSPFLEATAPGVCTLELKRSRKKPASRAAPLLGTLARLGLRARIGLARHPDLAWLAALHAGRGTAGTPAAILLVENSDDFLSELPLENLAPRLHDLSRTRQRTDLVEWRKLLGILEKWGIHTAGVFLALDREQIAARLGPTGLALHERAAPSRQRPLRLVPPPETFEEALEFEHEIETLEPLLFILRRFLDQLTVRLAAIHRVAAALTLRLNFSDKKSHERIFEIPSPTGSADILFRMLHTHLENFRADSPIVALRLSALPCEPASQQFSLFETALRDPNRFAETLARLAALVGHDRIGSPVNDDTHRPDAFTMRPLDLQAIQNRKSKIFPAPPCAGSAPRFRSSAPGSTSARGAARGMPPATGGRRKSGRARSGTSPPATARSTASATSPAAASSRGGMIDLPRGTRSQRHRFHPSRFFKSTHRSGSPRVDYSRADTLHPTG